MNKILLSIFILCSLIGFCKNVSIPDANFKKALLNHYFVIDTNQDGEIQISEAEVVKGAIYILNQKISDLTGIEAFINITELNCAKNKLKTLDLSKNRFLRYLYCYDNQLISLDLSNNPALERLNCCINQLISLDFSHNQHLIRLECFMNELDKLEVSQSVNLISLSCFGNQLKTLDISKNRSLIKFTSFFNPNLKTIEIHKNHDTSDWQKDEQTTFLLK